MSGRTRVKLESKPQLTGSSAARTHNRMNEEKEDNQEMNEDEYEAKYDDGEEQDQAEEEENQGATLSSTQPLPISTRSSRRSNTSSSSSISLTQASSTAPASASSSSARHLIEGDDEDEENEDEGNVLMAADLSRRKLRTYQRNFSARLSDESTLLTNPTAFDGALDKANLLHEQIDHVREAITDAEQMQLLGKIHYKQTKHQMQARSHTPLEYVDALKLRYSSGSGSDGREPIDWSRVGRDASHLFRSIPFTPFLHSTFFSLVSSSLPIKPPKRVAHRRAKPVVEPEHKAQEMTKDRIMAESTNGNHPRVEHMLRYIPDYETPVGYVEFILDPTSFARTVENVFDCSFLVKMDHVRIFIDEQTRLPMISLAKKKGAATASGIGSGRGRRDDSDETSSSSSSSSSSSHTNHVFHGVFELTHEIWREWKDAFQISSAYFPRIEEEEEEQVDVGEEEAYEEQDQEQDQDS